MKNTVATILKAYGIINSIASIMMAIYVYNEYSYPLYDLWYIVLATGLVISFLIYAAGEVVQLLQDIKDNTAKKTILNKPLGDHLPEL